jgi:hypothetical protein
MKVQSDVISLVKIGTNTKNIGFINIATKNSVTLV